MSKKKDKFVKLSTLDPYYSHNNIVTTITILVTMAMLTWLTNFTIIFAFTYALLPTCTSYVFLFKFNLYLSNYQKKSLFGWDYITFKFLLTAIALCPQTDYTFNSFKWCI